jgi:hypothetical protein
MGGWEGEWYSNDALLWVTLRAICVGGFRGMFWLGILVRIARGDGEGDVMHLFRAWVCGVFIGYALGSEVWWLVGEVGAIGTSRNLVSACLPPCSLRLFDALCGVGVNWMEHS